MRILPIAVVLLADHAHGAILPVYTTPQPNTKQLSLVNFGALGGDTVGVNHASSIADDPTEFTLQPVGAADFWLTALADYIVLQLSVVNEWQLLDRELLLPFALPAWGNLGDPLTITLTDYNITIPDRLDVGIVATDGATTLTDSYTLRIRLAPEPSAAVLAIAFFALRKRRRVAC
jgi:hypothetical protein